MAASVRWNLRHGKQIPHDCPGPCAPAGGEVALRGVPEAQEQAITAVVQASDPRPGERPGRGGNYPPKEHRWPPGVSGNPMGRKLSAELDRQLDDNDTAKLVIRSLLGKALLGDVSAIKEIFERHEGKVVQKSEVDQHQRTIIIEAGMDETPDPLPQEPGS